MRDFLALALTIAVLVALSGIVTMLAATFSADREEVGAPPPQASMSSMAARNVGLMPEKEAVPDARRIAD